MTPLDRQANLLGALALVITDQTAQTVAAAAGQPVSAAAALSALHHFPGRQTLGQLHKVLALTPSGAVRLVDRLADAGLVTRGPGDDGRSRTVHLTEAGQRAAGQITGARAALLRNVLGELSPAERETLHSLLSRIMASVVDGKEGGAWICRLCDLEACGRPAGHCPAASAAAAKAGTAKAGTAKAGTTKAGTTKAGTTKAGTTKAGTTRTAAAEQDGP